MAESQNTIKITFESDGDKILVGAIRKLDSATRNLLKAQSKLSKLGTAHIKTQKENTKVTGLMVRNFRNLNKTLNKGNVALSVFRSKLLLASFGMALFGSTIGRTIKALEKQQSAEKKLESAIKSTGNTTGITIKTLMAYASSLQAVTKFGDEQIIAGQALMLTFTKIGRDVFPSAIEASLNLSEAMGQDLQQTIIQVGKALNDPVQGISALRRVGIQLSEQQKILIKGFVDTNDVASAQKVILQELEKQFGGMATSATQTIGGALAQLNNAWSDLVERIGSKVAPALKTVADAVFQSTMLLMSEREKEIAILQRLGFSEELIGERRIAMYRETLSSLQATGVATGHHFDTIQDGLITINSMNQSYGGLIKSLKESTNVIQDDESAIEKLGEKYGESRAEMEFFIERQLRLNKGFGEFAKGGIATFFKEIANLKTGLDLQSDSTFSAIVANREHGESIRTTAEQYKEFITTLRALMEAMGHEFPEVVAKASLTSIENIKRQVATVQVLNSAWSGFTSAYKTEMASRESAELESMRNTSQYKDADADTRIALDKKIQDSYAKEKLRIFRMEQSSSLASIGMNTANAYMKTVALLPVTGGQPLAGIVIALGLAQAGMVMKQKPPSFEQGGLIGGRRHSQGGTMIEAEQGEFVMSRNAVSSIGASALNQMNQSGGAGLTLNISAPLVDETVLDTIIPAIQKAQRMNLA